MKFELTETKEVEVKYLKVEAGVRYWDDAIVNGEQDESGVNVPFKVGDDWCPVIEIESGTVLDWPEATTASFHFKVCDCGTYHLLDKEMNTVKTIEGYVPDGLCHGDEGFGDYIIFDVDDKGMIENYSNKINSDDWEDEE